ncbi:glycosyltransferase family 2 protein [Natronobacterium gregoryi]|uniref:Glycosyl transferase n=2 Tax=Natronobacterium gregoryi TaxID=44930 RepID=L0AFU4_NATGS|nr:glycosyltransferase family A protein [Natronobacterium gregoryi]AFZ72022.1 glycosyl transferase [Natronobacterium gregoryi SP2]ELY62704.1 family 2 glycosyl transferase [Natronobacterium gregoryi SP2]PLK20871.1 glycosyltransferase family 2 protein [Natronobacterium gregoryi SP2]SFJ20155.1 Glycosyl transferase family 2 [Natronobacterium gregoryi]
MELSAVVSTLNDRERLLTCLDALDERTPSSTEVIVVNGPSSDGTSGAVRERDDVDVLVEISERNPNVSRNAGLGVASGDVVAFLSSEHAVEAGWYSAIERTIENGADVATGPVTGDDRFGGVDPRRPRTIAGRDVTLFDGDNVAFARTVLKALDGFDEYLEVGGARDCAHRVAGLGFDVGWAMEMAVRREIGTDGGQPDADLDPASDWGAIYQSIAYRLAKNYGPRPSVVVRTLGSAIRDGVVTVRGVVSGDSTPTEWLSDGTDVAASAGSGLRDGIYARYSDRSARRNPYGLSARHNRAVQLYDRR